MGSLENQIFTLNEIKNLPLLTIGRIDKLSRNTSFSSILDSPQQKIESIHSDEQWNNSSEQKNKKEEDIDLLNECYDVLPLNNVKKHIGIKSWFI